MGFINFACSSNGYHSYRRWQETVNLLNALKYTVPVHTSIRTMESLKMIRTFLYLYVD